MGRVRCHDARKLDQDRDPGDWALGHTPVGMRTERGQVIPLQSECAPRHRLRRWVDSAAVSDVRIIGSGVTHENGCQAENIFLLNALAKGSSFS